MGCQEGCGSSMSPANSSYLLFYTGSKGITQYLLHEYRVNPASIQEELVVIVPPTTNHICKIYFS